MTRRKGRRACRGVRPALQLGARDYQWRETLQKLRLRRGQCRGHREAGRSATGREETARSLCARRARRTKGDPRGGSRNQGDAAAATGVVLRVGMADKLVFAKAAENLLTKISGDALGAGAPENDLALTIDNINPNRTRRCKSWFCCVCGVAHACFPAQSERKYRHAGSSG